MSATKERLRYYELILKRLKEFMDEETVEQKQLNTLYNIVLPQDYIIFEINIKILLNQIKSTTEEEEIPNSENEK